MKHSIAYDRNAPGHVGKKFVCPNCNKKRFVRFFNFETLEYLPEHFGKCDREDNCGYQQTPWEWLKTEGKQDSTFIKRDTPKKELRSDVRILEVNKDVLVKTMRHYELNNFAHYLQSILGITVTRALLAKYFIGTAKERGTIFWQVDRFMRIRTGQKIHYKLDGHRDKDNPFPSKRLFTIDKGYEPCLFGEHLIFDAPRDAIFALCESEKTAVICSAFFQQWNGRPLYWLATCGMHGYNDDKIKVLEGLDVLLVPDFSFTARAYWGLEPMRKQKNEKGILVPHPEGVLDTDYISLSKRLLAQGSGVEWYNPLPEVVDGSDLADHILTLPKPVFYERPNFDEFVMGGVVAKEPVYDTTAMVYEKYGYGIGGGKFDEMKSSLQKQVDLFQNPAVQKLANYFDCEPQFDY